MLCIKCLIVLSFNLQFSHLNDRNDTRNAEIGSKTKHLVKHTFQLMHFKGITQHFMKKEP